MSGRGDASSTSSTQRARPMSPTGADCSGNGAPEPDDDFNGDGSAGDILDCEIAGVAGARTASLAATSGVQAGLVAFANQAAVGRPGSGRVRDLPAARASQAVTRDPRVDTWPAASRATALVSTTPGPSDQAAAVTPSPVPSPWPLTLRARFGEWIMLLSDGASGIDNGVLAELGQSACRLGAWSAPTPPASPPRASTRWPRHGGELPGGDRSASLSAGLTGSQPDSLDGVTVLHRLRLGGGHVDAVGGWRARFTLGPAPTPPPRGPCSPPASQTAQRTFTVAGSAPAAPGT